MHRRTLAQLAAIAMTLVGGAAHAQDGDATRGERIFQYCFSCHSVDPSEPTRLEGPSLYHILNRPAASLKDFTYSEAMNKRAAEGLTWNTATLNAYVADPQAIVPGTRMSATPLRDDQARADLIAYLAKSGPYRP